MAKKTVSFNTAFAAARKAGKKVFSWNGKTYNTKLKGETKSSLPSSKNAPVPKERPGTKVASKNVPVPKDKPSATSGAKVAAQKPVGVQQDYPRPAKRVGIASPKSPLGRAIAKAENKPKGSSSSPLSIGAAKAATIPVPTPAPKERPVARDAARLKRLFPQKASQARLKAK